MNKVLLMIFVGLALSLQVNAQSQVIATSIYKKSHIKDSKPIPYSYVRESDVMWSKIVWRIIDLREKLNLSLYYPTYPHDDRYSLIDLLMDGVENKNLLVYDIEDDEFKVPISIDKIKERFDVETITTNLPDPLTGQMVPTSVTSEMHTEEVMQYIIKEQWFFDKQSSTMQTRIIGLCPIREYTKGTGQDARFVKTKLFWVYFPDVRELLATHEVFNPFNDAARFSYDDLFMKRRFSSFISQISNVHNNRQINEYTTGIHSLLESERIKTQIFNFEHDLWEY
jgi:gliding motility associated protien GldN